MLLEVDDINTYRGPAHVLRSVSINVDTDEVVALVGRNGAGRTTAPSTGMACDTGAGYAAGASLARA